MSCCRHLCDVTAPCLGNNFKNGYLTVFCVVASRGAHSALHNSVHVEDMAISFFWGEKSPAQPVDINTQRSKIAAWRYGARQCGKIVPVPHPSGLIAPNWPMFNEDYMYSTYPYVCASLVNLWQS